MRVSNSDSAPVHKPLVDAAKEWLLQDYEDKIDEFATAYDNEPDIPLRDESIRLSIEGLAENMGEEPAERLIDSGVGPVEASVKEAICRLVNERLDGGEMGDPIKEGWCIEWVDELARWWPSVAASATGRIPFHGSGRASTSASDAASRRIWTSFTTLRTLFAGQ